MSSTKDSFRTLLTESLVRKKKESKHKKKISDGSKKVKDMPEQEEEEDDASEDEEDDATKDQEGDSNDSASDSSESDSSKEDEDNASKDEEEDASKDQEEQGNGTASVSNNGEIGSSTEQNEEKEGTQRLFGPQHLNSFLDMARDVSAQLKRQSTRLDLPRCTVHAGFKTNKGISADECIGFVLLLLIIMTSWEGFHFIQLFGAGEEDCHLVYEEGSKNLGLWVEIMGMLLTLIAYLSKEGGYSEDEVVLLEKYLPLFCTKFRDTINGKEGMGMKIVKFHLPLHWPNLI